MEDELRVKITGDVADLKKSMTEAQRTFDSLSNKAKELQNDLAQNTTITNGYEKAMENLNREFKGGLIDQKNYSKGLERLKRDERETEIETKRLRAELLKVSKAQKDLAAVSPKLNVSMGNQAKATSGAQNTMMEFSRVMQDAPFGIQGVGNNITQLVTNFGYLTKSAGGAKAAFKVLISSFAGPAGIIFAVSTAVTLFTVFGSAMFKSSTEAEKLAKKTEDAAEAIKKYEDSLGGVDKARLEGNKSAAEELVSLTLLRSQIENTNLSQEERLDAIKKLQKEFPGYFENVKSEELLNGQAASSYDKLTNSILKRAKATAATDLLVENAKKEIALKQQLSEVEAGILANEEKKTKARDAFAKSTKEAASIGGNVSANAYVKTIAAENDLLEDQIKIKKDLDAIELQNVELSKFVTQNVIVEPEIKDIKGAKKAFDSLEKKARDNKKIIDNINKGLFLAESEEVRFKLEEVEKIYEASGARIEADAKGHKFELDTDEAFLKIVAYEEKLAEIKKAFGEENYNIALTLPTDQLDQFVAKLTASKIVADASTKAITTVFDNMGQALIRNADESGSALDRFTASLAASVLQIMATYLSQSIAAAIAGGSSSGAATGPGAIVAMPVMIAGLVAAVIGAFAAIPKFAQGGIMGGSTFNGDNLLARLNPSEMVLTNRQQANLFNVLNGSLRKNSAQNSGPIEIQGTLSGQDMLLSNARSSRNNKRFNG